ncbi:precorrin-6A synthase [Neorhizobium huautlense]|uniref:Precorrin-6A synthase [deacetylating] n=1 Tax=Neorhizobium huautlense TaxID=67774 RepID=A0ABT9PSY9_9HYPH|nr:precorrin-6A synthase (deacetylating) [Neorhizobium huautlense]MDP9837258.1 precorrin-6A synthase [Neorhizobium huautlense]
MRKIRVIGIGAGNPEHVTIQAVNALKTCDVLLVPTKGAEKEFLANLRREICDRFITERQPRYVHFAVPPRKSDGEYQRSVAEWHAAIAKIYEDLLLQQVGEDETVGLLVWGDPMLFDSTLRILEHVQANARVAFDYDVIAGITSLQALCASHRIPLNRIGKPVEITTGRRLSEGWPAQVDDIAVMLDGIRAYETVDTTDVTIHWGAYLGTPMEIGLSGRLADIGPEISKVRAEARAKHGWIMDTYILRRPIDEVDEDQ